MFRDYKDLTGGLWLRAVDDNAALRLVRVLFPSAYAEGSGSERSYWVKHPPLILGKLFIAHAWRSKAIGNEWHVRFRKLERLIP